MIVEIHVTVPDTIVAAAERTLKRQGVKQNSGYRRKLSQLLHEWAQRGLMHEAGEANAQEAVAQAVDRINARDAAELKVAAAKNVEAVAGLKAFNKALKEFK